MCARLQADGEGEGATAANGVHIEDTRRIHDEVAARSLWRAGAKGLTIANGRAFIDHKQAALSWAKRRAGIPAWRASAAAARQFVPGFFVSFGPEAIDRMILVFLFVLSFLEQLGLLDAQFKMMLSAMKPGCNHLKSFTCRSQF
jgi:hypothetical protein